MKNSLISIFALLIMVGCSGGKGQDPLADQPDNVKQGVPLNEKSKEDLTPVPRDAMRIEIEPDVVTFLEGQPGQFTIKADILGAEKEDFVIEFKNRPDGATYDQQTGKFIWTPPTDVVLGDNYMETYQLTIQMTTVKSPAMSIERKVPIFVQRDTNRPEIIKMNPPNEVIEGEELPFTVQVRDLDSTDGDLFRFREPHLTIVQTEANPRDGSSLVRLVPSTSSVPNPHRLEPNDPTFDPNLWIYTLVVDARGKELTSGRDNFKLGLIATSRFGMASAEGGVPSRPKALSIPIISKIPKAITTWDDSAIEFKEKETSSYTFDVYAPISALSYRSQPEGDGVLDPVQIKAKCNEQLPGSATCKCTKVKSWRYQCVMRWEVGSHDPAAETYPVAFRVVNRNSFRTTDTEVSEFLKRVKIVK